MGCLRSLCNHCYLWYYYMQTLFPEYLFYFVIRELLPLGRIFFFFVGIKIEKGKSASTNRCFGQA